MMSSDGGESWNMTAFPLNYYVAKIAIISPTVFAAGARSNLHNSTDGGVWMTQDAGNTWHRTLSSPVFDLLYEPTTNSLIAALPMSLGSTVMASWDQGVTWEAWSTGLFWNGKVPFYPCLAVSTAVPPVLFVGSLTVNVSDTRRTSSGIFHRTLAASEAAAEWSFVANQPELDDDAMPKDRMALLVDPDQPELLCVPPPPPLILPVRHRFASFYPCLPPPPPFPHLPPLPLPQYPPLNISPHCPLPRQLLTFDLPYYLISHLPTSHPQLRCRACSVTLSLRPRRAAHAAYVAVDGGKDSGTWLAMGATWHGVLPGHRVCGRTSLRMIPRMDLHRTWTAATMPGMALASRYC